jgi:hypothetical protein
MVDSFFAEVLTMKKVTLSLRESQLLTLREMARERNMPWSALARYAIDDFLFANKEGPEPDGPVDGRRQVKRVRDPRGRFTSEG